MMLTTVWALIDCQSKDEYLQAQSLCDWPAIVVQDS